MERLLLWQLMVGRNFYTCCNIVVKLHYLSRAISTGGIKMHFTKNLSPRAHKFPFMCLQTFSLTLVSSDFIPSLSFNSQLSTFCYLRASIDLHDSPSSVAFQKVKLTAIDFFLRTSVLDRSPLLHIIALTFDYSNSPFRI